MSQKRLSESVGQVAFSRLEMNISASFLTGGESFALALSQPVFLFGWCGGMVCAYVCVRTLN